MHAPVSAVYMVPGNRNSWYLLTHRRAFVRERRRPATVDKTAFCPVHRKHTGSVGVDRSTGLKETSRGRARTVHLQHHQSGNVRRVAHTLGYEPPADEPIGPKIAATIKGAPVMRVNRRARRVKS